MSKVELHYKSFIAENKITDDRTVTGITATFGNIDSVGDILHPGAFAKTIQEGGKRAKHLWQHDTFEPPIATILSLREVEQLELPEAIKQAYPEATGGLEVTRKYLESIRGEEILLGIKENAITEMSFGFNIIRSDFSEIEDMTVRNLREVRLWDTSDVLWGANPATVAQKSAIDFKFNQINELINSIMSDLEGVDNQYDYLMQKAQDIDIDDLAIKLSWLQETIEAEPIEEVTPLPLTSTMLAKLELAQRELQHLGV